MALFLPLMVGVMVGDVVYGALLLGLALLVRRRFAAGSAALRDLTRVFVAGALWAIVFGLLFGEALGDVGHRLGLPALWFYRGGADAVEPLLLVRARARGRSRRARAAARPLAVGERAPARGAAQPLGLAARAGRCLRARRRGRRPHAGRGAGAVGRGRGGRGRSRCS